MNPTLCYQLYEAQRPKTAAEQHEIDAGRGRTTAALSRLVRRTVLRLVSLRSHQPSRMAPGEMRKRCAMILTPAP